MAFHLDSFKCLVFLLRKTNTCERLDFFFFLIYFILHFSHRMFSVSEKHTGTVNSGVRKPK